MQMVTKKVSEILISGAPIEVFTERFTHSISVISCSIDLHTLTPVLVKKYYLVQGVLFRTIYDAPTISDFVSSSNEYLFLCIYVFR